MQGNSHAYTCVYITPHDNAPKEFQMFVLHLKLKRQKKKYKIKIINRQVKIFGEKEQVLEKLEFYR